ncbi:MAG TPA: hypothetical protein VMB73_29535 [Acetobacteraceae bacterium]|nr:hypothetical protein [Acetobacteraceae bacterium]
MTWASRAACLILIRMHRQNLINDDDIQPVIVPRNDKRLVAVPDERKQRLREHLIKELADLRKAKHLEHFASPERPEPTGFAARVAQTACSLCKGFCCRNGGDDGFLDDRTLARVRLAKQALTEGALRQLYLDRVPSASFRGSCIFHGSRGCTLDRSMRADVCNSYFCGGLGTYVKSCDQATPALVIAGDGDKMRTSSVLMP